MPPVLTRLAPRLLVVEEDDEYRALLAGQLQTEGFQVWEVLGGSAAMAAAKRARPAVAVVHVGLKGGANGYDVCRDLLRERLCPFVLLLTSTYLRPEDRWRAFEAGAAGFHLKDGEIDQIAARLSRAARELLGVCRPLRQLSLPPVRRGLLGPVVVADDDPECLRGLCLHLEAAGFETFAAEDGARAIGLAVRLRPKAVLLDVGLPDASGMEVLQCLKHHPLTRDARVLLRTGKNLPGRERDAYRFAADAYLVKGDHDVSAVPFLLQNLLGLRPDDGVPLAVGPVTLDPGSLACTVGGRPVELTDIEFRLLRALLSRSPQVITWAGLVTAGWDIPSDLLPRRGAPNTLRQHLLRLRRKLGPARGCLQVFPGLGLQFIP